MAYAMTAFSMSLLTWLAWYGVQEGTLHQLIANGCLWLLGAIFLIYVAGATIDDLVSIAKGWRGLPDRRDKERPNDP
jgi:hypothetical protein